MRQIHQTMGTVASVDITSAGQAVFNDVFAWLDYVSEQFSVFNPSSQVNRYNRGEIKQLSEEINYIIKKSADYQKATGGYFSAYFDGRFNPTGLVKGWAIKKAGELIESKGFKEYMVNIGGDILAKGPKAWRVGVQNPKDRSQLIGVIEAKNLGIATSGTYERGNHIINPVDSAEATELLSVTVTGPDIEKADVLATAICAMGPQKGLKFINSVHDYAALIFDQNLKVYQTPSFVYAKEARPLNS